jgi:ABC transporter substrate binding protein
MKAQLLAVYQPVITVPTMGAYRDFTRAGGLMSYGSDLGDAYRRVGLCAARILNGEVPSDLPVTQSTKVEFVLNLAADLQQLGHERIGTLALALEVRAVAGRQGLDLGQLHLRHLDARLERQRIDFVHRN